MQNNGFPFFKIDKLSLSKICDGNKDLPIQFVYQSFGHDVGIAMTTINEILSDTT